MNSLHKKRLVFILLIICSVAIATSLALYALQQNINLFYSPSQVAAGQAPHDHKFRLGGMVKEGSIEHASSGLLVSFIVTDRAQEVKVKYNGILPNLFRDGQGVVIDGKLDGEGNFWADQVLAKHDERYMPAQVRAMLKEGKA